jgi:uncharacterized membrane protein
MYRITYIDNIRGIAFILMIIQHIFYFYDVSMDYITEYSSNKIVSTSGLIARTLFILLAGLSIGLYFKNKKSDDKDKIKNRIKRSVEIGLHGLLITLVTYLIYPKYFVRFGILQFLALGTLIMGMPGINPYVVILVCLLLNNLKTTNNDILNVILGLNNKYSMMDYFPLLKWLPVMAIGVILGQNIELKEKTDIKLLDESNALTYLGKNSLNLYTIHVIVLILYFSYMNKK